MNTNELQHLNTVSRIYATEAGQLNRDITSFYSCRLNLRNIKGGRVLQLGVGDGLIAEALCDQADQVDVIEGSSEVITQFGTGKRFSVHHTLFEDYAPEIPYDIVVGNHVLEHVADPVEIARLALGWLYPGGKALFTVPNATSLHRRIGVKMGLIKHIQELNEQDIELGHRRVYTPVELQNDLCLAGFERVDISGYMLKMVSHQQMKDWRRELLDACFEASLECDPHICSNIMALCYKSQ